MNAVLSLQGSEEEHRRLVLRPAGEPFLTFPRTRHGADLPEEEAREWVQEVEAEKETFCVFVTQLVE